MATLLEEAKDYEPKQTKNIADIPEVPTDIEVHTRFGTNKKGEPYEYKYALLNGDEYRIPDIVLSQMKTILKSKPTLKKIKVDKEGSGLQTKYLVIALD